MKHNTTKAEFGKVAMIRMTCPKCNSPALVVDGKMACCGVSVDKPKEYKVNKKESEGSKTRGTIPQKTKDKIVSDQLGLCFYCQQPFGTPVWHPRRHEVIRPGLVFDHFVCWAFSCDSSEGNLVAACSICNSIKRDLLFTNVEDARAYVRNRFIKKGYEYNYD